MSTYMACKKDGHGVPAASVPRVRTLTTTNGSSVEVKTYSYDNKGRLVLVESSLHGKDMYFYTDTGIIRKMYNQNDTLVYAAVYTLNSRGLTTGYTIKGNTYDNYTSTYNADGQLSDFSDVQTVPGQPKDVWSYHCYYSNGNMDSIVYTDRYDTVVRRDADYYDAYFTDVANTVGNDNFGLGWMGHSSKNPVKVARDLGLDGSGHRLQATFEYQYDSLGRITRQTRIRTGATYPTYSYTYY